MPREFAFLLVAAVVTFQICTTITTSFYASWTLCKYFNLDVFWALQYVQLGDSGGQNHLYFDAQGLQGSQKVQELRSTNTFIIVCAMIAMSISIIAVALTLYASFGAREMSKVKPAFRVSAVILAVSALLRFIGWITYLAAVVPSIGQMNPLDALGGAGGTFSSFLNREAAGVFDSVVSVAGHMSRCTNPSWQWGLVGALPKLISQLL